MTCSILASPTTQSPRGLRPQPQPVQAPQLPACWIALDQIVEAYLYVETGQKVGNVVITVEHSDYGSKTVMVMSGDQAAPITRAFGLRLWATASAVRSIIQAAAGTGFVRHPDVCPPTDRK